jgi:peptidoglycan/xylan/chitin deacetylase (PgdA/CDA1 family)
MRRVLWLPVLALAALALTAMPANARWTRPAAGPSSTGDVEIVFTFDDGPHERYTRMILDELAARDIKAIFYWVGHRVKNKGRHAAARHGLVARAVTDGHVIANHTINHVHLCAVNAAVAEAEIDGNARLYEQLTGLPQILFRAPYGDYCGRLLDMLDARDLAHMHWDIDPLEWRHHSSQATAAAIIRKLSRLEGRGVVLMHDTKLASVRALPIVLDWIDSENARRAKTGRRPMRIVSGSDLAIEKLELGIGRWVQVTALDARASLVDAVARLVPGHGPSRVSQR